MEQHKLDSVLLKAAKRGDADTMALAIHAGANPRAVDDLTGGSVLQLAATRGCAEGVRLLLSAGVDANAAESADCPALVCAAYKGRLPVMKLLLETGSMIFSYLS